MHIGLDGIPLTEPKTGIGHYTFELAAALAGVAPESSFELAYPSTFAPINIAEQTEALSLPANLELRRVRVGPLGRHWWSAGLPRHVRSSGIELFHGTNYDIPLWRRCATVLTIHDLSQLLHPETHEKRSVRRARRRIPLMARTADAIITPTQSVRREVCERLKTNPEKVFAIPEAARACFHPLAFGETAEVRGRLGIGNDFLLTVGTLEPRKNLSVLVNAFEEVMRAWPQSSTQLVIVGGRGWLSGPLFTAIERSPVRNRILLTDYLHDEDLRALYASCHAFIYPSIYEGFGLPPLEAMACGAPVIASRIPALAETTGDAGLLFDHISANDLAQKILALVGDENARQKLSNAGLKRASEFSWERTAQLTLEVYTKALAKKGRA
ncbi:MAG: glycosyltransferase family 4 protein [Pyrinomonadaceae bacterium]|nr:glycosyltransferase family 4 protein [Pyrinomonadaceae bacterium]